VVEHATVEAVKSPNLNPVSPTPAVNQPSVPKPAPAVSSEPGQQEYLQAQEILKNRNRQGAVAEAVRLLWIAVEKGNSGAEIALAELYRKGQGVAKNCDQAKILLTAAARKGSAEAQKRLEKLRKEGCE
jgi:TPR repeat protein